MENEEDSNWYEDFFLLLNLFVFIFFIAQATVINVQSSVIAGSKKSDKYLPVCNFQHMLPCCDSAFLSLKEKQDEQLFFHRKIFFLLTLQGIR